MPKKPRPDFLGLMNVMQRKADEVQECRHENVERVGLTIGRPGPGGVVEIVRCQSCGIQISRAVDWPRFWKEMAVRVEVERMNRPRVKHGRMEL